MNGLMKLIDKPLRKLNTQKIEGGNKMIVQELEIPLSQVTLQDCMDMYFFRGKSATINDGELKGFEKEPYVQEIIGGRV